MGYWFTPMHLNTHLYRFNDFTQFGMEEVRKDKAQWVFMSLLYAVTLVHEKVERAAGCKACWEGHAEKGHLIANLSLHCFP